MKWNVGVLAGHEEEGAEACGILFLPLFFPFLKITEIVHFELSRIFSYSKCIY